MPEVLLGLLFLGPGAFVLAGGLSYALGPSPRRMIAVAVLGALLVLGLFAWGWVDSSATEDCFDCSLVLGRWMSPVFVFYLLVNAVAWIAGALIGWSVRQARTGRRPAEPPSDP